MNDQVAYVRYCIVARCLGTKIEQDYRAAAEMDLAHSAGPCSFIDGQIRDCYLDDGVTLDYREFTVIAKPS